MLTIQNYRDTLKKNRVLGSVCKECGNIMIPLNPICSRCGSFDVEKFESRGEGKIRSFTVIYIAPGKFKDEAPYVVGLIHLDEGGTVMGRITGAAPNKLEDIKVGTKVKLEAFVEGEEAIVAFRLNN
jgi:hypothetical protein